MFCYIVSKLVIFVLNQSQESACELDFAQKPFISVKITYALNLIFKNKLYTTRISGC